mgnify:CR=1 FL=1
MQKIEKALLLVANLSQDKKILDYRIEEILNLCDTSKVDIQGIVVQNIKKPLRKKFEKNSKTTTRAKTFLFFFHTEILWRLKV